MKWIAAILILAGLGVLASDYFGAEAGAFRLTSTGEWWFALHPDSLQVLQPAVERHLSVWLYAEVIQPVLIWPLSVELIVLGVCLLALWLLFRRGPRRA